mmetsp:Transcript_3363/g.7889  ORF Transcript_3363/g.7889 Transcript_3363/m.7889 type:complete len:108 (-) Transcript_3363:266-589(-)
MEPANNMENKIAKINLPALKVDAGSTFSTTSNGRRTARSPAHKKSPKKIRFPNSPRSSKRNFGFGEKGVRAARPSSRVAGKNDKGNHLKENLKTSDLGKMKGGIITN